MLFLKVDLLSESSDGAGRNELASRVQLREGGLLEAERVQFGCEWQHTVVVGECQNFSLVARFPRCRIAREDNDLIFFVGHSVHGLEEADREG